MVRIRLRYRVSAWCRGMLAPPGYAKITSTPCRTSDSTTTSAPVIGFEEVLVRVWRSSMAATADPLSQGVGRAKLEWLFLRPITFSTLCPVFHHQTAHV